MGRVGAALLVMTVTALAHGIEPGASVPSALPQSPYAAVALAEARPRPPAHAEFQTDRLPAHPLRASMTSNEVSAVGVNASSSRTIRVVLDPEAVASFPVDSDEAPAAVPLFNPRARVLSIRKNLDDDAGVFEQTGLTRRLIRQTIDDTSDWPSVSAARHLRSTLD
jgi:hypothetical protein